MRYQQPIYVQNTSNCVRNRDLLNVNMSSDICVFEQPDYTVSGGCKITSGITTADTCVHIVNSYSDIIDLDFSITGGTTATTFSLELYKYDSAITAFTDTAVYAENNIELSGTYSTNIMAASLNIDGEYLIKLFYKDLVCTDILSRLGLAIDTKDYFNGELYDKYTPDTDFYFIVFSDATVPLLNIPSGNITPLNSLHVTSYFPDFDGQIEMYINNIYNDEVIVNLNGLTLSRWNDYTLSNHLLTFSGGLKTSDIVTIIGISSLSSTNANGTTHDSFLISAISSGATGGEGNNDIYYNTDTNKYELFTTLDQNGMPIVSINGVTLAPLIDYNQSTNNPKKIILEGNLLINDVIMIIYQSYAYIQNNVTQYNPSISWRLIFPPQNALGWFDFELSETSDFSTIAYSGTQNYVIGEIIYKEDLDLSGYSVGDTLYYRVTNHKIYETISGDLLERVKMTDVIPITIMINS